MPKKTGVAPDTLITGWLILGAFPNPDPARILAAPYLPEPLLAPSPGEHVAHLEWRPVYQKNGVVDLNAIGLHPREYCAVYAFTYVHAARNVSAKLLLGSDDGVAAWVNGQEVWRKDVTRLHTLKEDAAAVRLQKGWNRLLVKISQFTMGWMFSGCLAAACPLKFSLRNPAPKRFPRLRLPAASLSVASMSFVRQDDEALATVKVSLYNSGAAEARGATLALVDAAGKRLAETTGAPLKTFAFGTTEFPVDLKVLAGALSREDVALEVRWGKAAIRWELAAAEAVRLLALAGCAGTELRDLGRRLQDVLDLYAVPREEVAGPARQGLAALAAGESGKAAAALRAVLAAVLRPLPDRKDQLAHVVGHAHIDMNWMWTYPETLKSFQDNFRQVCAFMDEYPDFTFFQSQAACYAAIEKLDPPLFERIRQRVKEGRWEPGGGMWVEGDTNMSSGEALARSFLLAQRYFLSRFGQAARTGWLPDNFGHVSQLPQILRLAGAENFYGSRCTPFLGTFWWKAPDGSKILCYSNRNYNGRITKELEKDFETLMPDKARLLVSCGVGDHGGGPTREDIETAHRLDSAPRYPAVKFSTAGEFFSAAREEMEGRPTHRGEMQFVFEGCYTTIARVKEGNRRCESALYEAELLATLRRLAGEAYPAEKLRRAWEIVAFNEFHDILCGSGIHEANADAVADYKWARTRAETIRDAALRKLADEVRTVAEKGQPVVVLNAQPRKRRALVEAEIYSHEAPATATLSGWDAFYGAHQVGGVDRGQGPVPSILVRDPQGRAVPAQVVWGKNFPPGWRYRVQFIAEDLPAGGYRAYYVDPARPGEFNEPIPEKNGVFETEFFRVGFDLKTGEIKRLYDKRTRTELAAKGGGLNRLRIYLEKPHSMSAWTLGEIERAEDVGGEARVRITERGPVRVCVEAHKQWGRSKFIQRTYLYRSYPRIDFELEAHWFEQGSATALAPMLRAVFPLGIKPKRFDCHVPFDVAARPLTGQEVPAQQWVDVTDGKAGLALLNQTKYGHSFEKGELRLTLLRSSYDPDIYPDQGLHRIKYAIYPHAGDWKSGVWEEGEAFNSPALATEPPSAALGKSHATRPEEDAMLSLEPAHVRLSGVKEAEEGGEVVVRFAEIEGRRGVAVLTLPVPVKCARRFDLIERPLEGVAAPEVSGRSVRVDVRPHEIITLGLEV